MVLMHRKSIEKYSAYPNINKKIMLSKYYCNEYAFIIEGDPLK